MSSRPRNRSPRPNPPIGDYALIGDCHSSALISRAGSIDWCCLPRFDSGSYFGRLLGWETGGHCSLAAVRPTQSSTRRYLEGTLVLETIVHSGGGEARVLDFFAMPPGGARDPYRQIVRIVDGMRDRGVLIGRTGRDRATLKIRPPLVFGDEHVDLLTQVLTASLAAVG